MSSISSGGGMAPPPGVPPAAGGGNQTPPPNVSAYGGMVPFDSQTQHFQLPGDLERLAQQMGKSMGPDGVKAMEKILQGMLMNMINSSRQANQQFVDSIQEATDDDGP